MKLYFNTSQEIINILKSKIFTVEHIGTYLFEEDTYAIFPGNISLFIQRSEVIWKNVNPKHKYSITRDGGIFIFQTYKNELYKNENIFVILITEDTDNTYVVILRSEQHDFELRLISE